MHSGLRVGAGFKPAPTENERELPQRQRRAIRLRGYDYAAPGAYFVTVCTRNRACILGDVTNGEMCLSEAGRLTQSVWEELPRHYPHVALDAWVIMPNHVHGIVMLTPELVGAGFKPAPTNNADAARHGLPEIVRAFKTFSARRVNNLMGTQGVPFWQRSYYEHVIRDETALNNIRQYIMDNPRRWDEDPDNPDVLSHRGGFQTRPYEAGSSP